MPSTRQFNRFALISQFQGDTGMLRQIIQIDNKIMAPTLGQRWVAVFEKLLKYQAVNLTLSNVPNDNVAS